LIFNDATSVSETFHFLDVSMIIELILFFPSLALIIIEDLQSNISFHIVSQGFSRVIKRLK